MTKRDVSEWFADWNEDDGVWQLCLDTKTGLCPSIDIGFTSEADAIDFLDRYIMGAVKE